MASVGQIVQIVITGNSDQAIASIEKLATATEASAKKSAKSFENFGKAATLGLVAAGAAIAAFGIKQAMEQETATAKLKTAINNTGAAYADYTDKIEKASTAAINLGFDDADLATSLARLTSASHSVGTALHDMSLAEDIARARHLSLQAATDLLAKVETGHVALLGRLGIATKDASGATISQEEAIKRLTAMYGGTASAYTQTFAGKIEVLKAQMGELAEKVGFVLIPIIEKLVSGFSGAFSWLEKNKVAAAALALVIGGPLVASMVAWIATMVAAKATAFGSLLVDIGLEVGILVEKMAALDSAMIAENFAMTVGTLGLAALVVAMGTAVDKLVGMEGAYGDLKDAQEEGTKAGKRFADANIAVASALKTPTDQANFLKLRLIELKGQLAAQVEAYDRGKLSVDGAAKANSYYESSTKAIRGELARLKTQQEMNVAATTAYNAELDKVTRGTLAFRDSSDKARNAIYALQDALFGQTDASAAYQKSLDDVAEATDNYAAAASEFGANSPEAVKAWQDLTDAKLHSAEASSALDKANTELYDKINTGGKFAYDTELKRLQDLQAQYPKNAAQYQDQIDKLQKIWWLIINTPDNKNFVFNASETPGFQQAVADLKAIALMPDGTINPNFMSGVTPYASGGWVGGYGSTDSVPAMLTPGEFVVKKDGSNLGDVVGAMGGGGDTFHIYTMSPEEAANEVVRKRRTAAWLGA